MIYSALNMIAAEIPAKLLSELDADPRIAAISPTEKHSVNLVNSVPALGAPAFGPASYRGWGESVAVLDTG